MKAIMRNWRFAAGLQQDIFNPLNPSVLPFTVLTASGNTGLLRSQGRIERFFHPSDESQIVVTLGMSEPIPTLVPSAKMMPVKRVTRSPLPAAMGLSGQTARGIMARTAIQNVSPLAKS